MSGYTKRSDEELRRLIAIGPKALSTNVLSFDLASELIELRARVHRLEAGGRMEGCQGCHDHAVALDWCTNARCNPRTTATR